MKVTIKTLQQKQVPLEIDPSKTVLDLKTLITQSPELGSPNVERQKLIHSGKILTDEQALSATPIKDNDFIVLMITNVGVSQSQAKKTTNTPVTTFANDKAKSNPTDPTSSSTNPATTTITGESTLVTGSAYDEAISRIVEMGFPRDQAVRAMKAGFNNPERAIEYLTNGFPNNAESEATEEQPTIEGQDSLNATALDFLRTDPQFRQLRMVIQQNPQLIGPVLEQLGQTSPALFNLIEQHREEFIALMSEPDDGASLPEDMDDDDEEQDDEDEDGPVGRGIGEENNMGIGNLPANAQYIQVSEDEKASIDRLVGLGFDRARAIEAFFACDKNEEVAANFLFDHLNDED